MKWPWTKIADPEPEAPPPVIKIDVEDVLRKALEAFDYHILRLERQRRGDRERSKHEAKMAAQRARLEKQFQAEVRKIINDIKR